MKKSKGSNKGEKAAPSIIKSIDWDAISVSEPVDIIGLKGNTLKADKAYQVTKATAILLVNKGFAKLA
jgi:hypothetical protein